MAGKLAIGNEAHKVAVFYERKLGGDTRKEHGLIP